MKKINIAYIGGGSRGWARILMNDLTVEESLYGCVRLFDTDYQAASENALIGNLYNEADGAASNWEYSAVKTMAEALDGADFVIISILPGTFDDMHHDVHYPEKFGIYQSVGDTVGPGGIMRSVRAIPMYADIALAIREHCPGAAVISYTNPMTVLTKTLFSVFPDIRAFGCCHEVFGTQRLLAKMAEGMGLADDIDKDDIKVNVLGINHFTWIDNAKLNGTDLIPYYRKFAEKHRDSGFSGGGKWDDTPFSSGNMVKFDLFLRYGLIAAAGDRHLAEFCPGWYLKDPGTAARWKFSLTPVQWRKNDLANRIDKTQRILSGREKIELRHTGEEGVQMIKALAGMGDIRTNVNTINIGQHEGLPQGAVTETNALFSKGRIEPVKAGRLPRDIESLVMRHVCNQESLVEACLAHDAEGIFRVFINDPLVHLPVSEARKLFDEMFKRNARYLRGGK